MTLKFLNKNKKAPANCRGLSVIQTSHFCEICPSNYDVIHFPWYHNFSQTFTNSKALDLEKIYKITKSKKRTLTRTKNFPFLTCEIRKNKFQQVKKNIFNFLILKQKFNKRNQTLLRFQSSLKPKSQKILNPKFSSRKKNIFNFFLIQSLGNFNFSNKD